MQSEEKLLNIIQNFIVPRDNIAANFRVYHLYQIQKSQLTGFLQVHLYLY